jgi:hypothetical protein
MAALDLKRPGLLAPHEMAAVALKISSVPVPIEIRRAICRAYSP